MYVLRKWEEGGGGKYSRNSLKLKDFVQVSYTTYFKLKYIWKQKRKFSLNKWKEIIAQSTRKQQYNEVRLMLKVQRL